MTFIVLCGDTRGAEIHLHSQYQSDGTLVTLGDLAEIHASDQREADALATVELFAPPASSRQRHVRVREIQDLLLLRGINLTQHRFSGSNQVAIFGNSAAPDRQSSPSLPTSSQSRTAQRRICEAIADYLQQTVAADQHWQIEVQPSPAQARAAATTHSISVRGGSAPWVGMQRFELTVTTAEGPMRFPIEARVTIPRSVVTAARDLRRGEIIRAEDLEFGGGAPAAGEQDVFYSIDEVVGKETTQSIVKGKVILIQSIRAPLLVRRNDVVTVFSRSSGILVRTTGRARDEGSLGELVPVESLSDRTRTFFARVSDVRQVEVYAHTIRVQSPPARPTTRRLRPRPMPSRKPLEVQWIRHESNQPPSTKPPSPSLGTNYRQATGVAR